MIDASKIDAHVFMCSVSFENIIFHYLKLMLSTQLQVKVEIDHVAIKYMDSKERTYKYSEKWLSFCCEFDIPICTSLEVRLYCFIPS